MTNIQATFDGLAIVDVNVLVPRRRMGFVTAGGDPDDGDDGGDDGPDGDDGDDHEEGPDDEIEAPAKEDELQVHPS